VRLSRLVVWLEIAGGTRPLPESWVGRPDVAVAVGVWWIVLIVLGAVFAGRATKFLYVDF
jgi:hypothetical protein